jgi:EmrB/QacA subfamily drug resistance transporter
MSETAVAPSPTQAVAPPAQPGGGGLSQRQIKAIFIGLMLGMFLAALDQMIVGTAIRTIADDLHGLSIQAWATTAYLITSTITTPLYGKLSDMYGRKPFFLTAIILFIVGSIACTFATDMYQLAAFRGFQGLGAGGLMALAFAIIGDILAPRERAKYQGYFIAVFGTSSVLGPVLGGFFAGQSEILGLPGWRWVFLVNVPIAAVALIVVAKVLNVPHTPRKHRIDWPGALALVICLVPLLVIAEQGREWGWGSPRAIACYVLGGLGLILFILAERWAGEDALLPLRLFRNGVFSLLSIGGFWIGMAMFGGMAMIPLYLQIVHGASPTKAGLLILPMVMGIMLGSLLSGQLTARTGRYKIFPIIGTLLMLAGLILMWRRVAVDTALWEFDIYMAMIGLGLGQCMQTITLASQNAVSPRDMGVASAGSTFFRQMGGTLGTAVFLSVLFSTVGDKIKAAFQTHETQVGYQHALQDPKVLAQVLNPHNSNYGPIRSMLLNDPKTVAQLEAPGSPYAAQVHQLVASKGATTSTDAALNDTSFLQHIDKRLAHPFLQGFSNSMDLVFLLTAGVALIAFVVMLVTKEIPLRMQSGLDAQASEGGAPSPSPSPAEVAAEQAANPAVPTGAAAMAADAAEFGRHAADRDPTLVGAGVPADAGWLPAGGVPLRGVVRQQGGLPVPEAALTVIDPVGQQVARGTSGPDGRYAISVHRPGNYVLITRARAHQPQASMVTVDSEPVELNVQLAGSAGLLGSVTRVGGEAVAGATVVLADASGEVIATHGTDPRGTYEFGELLGGSYTLAVNAPLYQPVALLVEVPETGRVRQDLELVGGAHLRGTARGGPDGRPVPDARVSLVDDQTGQLIATTTTDPAGRYAFAEVPEGKYTVVATGYPPAESRVSLNVGQRYDHDVVLSHPDN